LDGALAQTYSPLEIILSDDCSSDRTFELILERVREYGGRHKIIVNRNDQNLGIEGHVNKILSLASGELIVMAAGDDVSHCDRCSILVRNWLANGKPDGIGSGFVVIDEAGVSIERTPLRINKMQSLINDKKLAATDKFSLSLNGCSAAWSKKVWNFFGPFRHGVVCEDDVMFFRALLLHGVYFVDEELVRYRSHSGNISNRRFQAGLVSMRELRESALFEAKQYEIQVSKFAQMRADLHLIVQSERIIQHEAEILLAKIREGALIAEVRSVWWKVSTFRRIRRLKFVMSPSGYLRYFYILPLPLYVFARWLRGFLIAVKLKP
jgi:glycosyltransferase involved in cell wall biosynthesis